MKTFASINKFTNKMLELFPEAKVINVLFLKDSIYKNDYDKLNANVLAIGIESPGSKKMLRYESVIEKFGGELVISFNPSKSQKAVKSKLQVISITTEKSEFKGHEFYPSKVLAVNSIELLNKLEQFKEKYKEANTQEYQIDSDEIDFV